MTFPKRVFLGFSLVACLATPLRAGEALTKTGDVLQILLPAIAGVCAIRQGMGSTFAAGFITAESVTHGVKAELGTAKVNQRPDGSGHGMPSGHVAVAYSMRF